MLLVGEKCCAENERGDVMWRDGFHRWSGKNCLWKERLSRDLNDKEKQPCEEVGEECPKQWTIWHPETGESGFCAMIQRKVCGLSVKHRVEGGSQRGRERPNHVGPWSLDKSSKCILREQGPLAGLHRGIVSLDICFEKIILAAKWKIHSLYRGESVKKGDQVGDGQWS